jgi:carotenoid cleavage dioxygenase-like enzyme
LAQDLLLFPILPLVGSFERAKCGQSAFVWEPDKDGRVGIVRRDAASSQMRWFRCDPCYVYHVMNAYEAGNTVIAHVMQYYVPAETPDDAARHPETGTA